MNSTDESQNHLHEYMIQGATAVSKSIVKLFDTVGEQLALFLEPTHIRRKAHAEAEALVTKEKAKAEIAKLKVEKNLAIQDLKDRAQERVRKIEEKRQANLEAITAKAVEALPDTVSEVPVDADWTAQFFDQCKDVGNEQMQTIWAKLLAGEVTQPGTFSRRTLSIVKVMSKDDADLFTRFCSYVWQTPEGLVSIMPEQDTSILNHFSYDLDTTALFQLDTLGLINYSPIGDLRLMIKTTGDFVITYHGIMHSINKSGSISVGQSVLTKPGEELVAISGSQPNEEYRQWVISTLEKGGWQIQIDNPNIISDSKA